MATYIDKMITNIDACMATPLWRDRLKSDIEAGEVFVSFRADEIGFYHYNKLFGYKAANSFTTNRKYAAILDTPNNDYVTEAQLRDAELVRDFYAGYEQIKPIVKTYAKPEALQRMPMIKNFSYANKKNTSPFVVLDVEFGFLGRAGDKSNVDITLYNKQTREIRFVEVKRLGDDRLKTNEINAQIKKYADATRNNRDEILAFYTDYIAAANKMFGLNIPAPTEVCEKIGLLICEFDGVHRDEILRKSNPSYRACGAAIREKGDTETLTERTMDSWWKQWNNTTC